MTGIFLAFYYVPDAAGNPATAYLSVRDVIDNQVYLGWLISMLRLDLGGCYLNPEFAPMIAGWSCPLGQSGTLSWHSTAVSSALFEHATAGLRGDGWQRSVVGKGRLNRSSSG